MWSRDILLSHPTMTPRKLGGSANAGGTPGAGATVGGRCASAPNLESKQYSHCHTL